MHRNFALTVLALSVVAACGQLRPTATPTVANPQASLPHEPAVSCVECGSSTAPAGPSGFADLDVAPGLGLGIGPTGGCGDVAFADLRLRGESARTPAIWVELVETGELPAARWPPGFRARFEPRLVIYDAHGGAVLRDGDVLTNVGGYPADAPKPIRLFSFNGVDYPCE